MRLTIEQARALGKRIDQTLVDQVAAGKVPDRRARAVTSAVPFTDKAEAAPVTATPGPDATQSAPASPVTPSASRPQTPVPQRKTGQSDPREILFAALEARFGNYGPENPGGVAREVGGALPGRRFRLDFALVDRRIAIELDGFKFHRDKKSYGRDRERSRKLFAVGWETIRVTAGQVFEDVDQVLDDIAAGMMYRQPRGFIPFKTSPSGWVLLRLPGATGIEQESGSELPPACKISDSFGPFKLLQN